MRRARAPHCGWCDEPAAAHRRRRPRLRRRPARARARAHHRGPSPGSVRPRASRTAQRQNTRCATRSTGGSTRLVPHACRGSDRPRARTSRVGSGSACSPPRRPRSYSALPSAGIGRDATLHHAGTPTTFTRRGGALPTRCTPADANRPVEIWAAEEAARGWLSRGWASPCTRLISTAWVSRWSAAVRRRQRDRRRCSSTRIRTSSG